MSRNSVYAREKHHISSLQNCTFLPLLMAEKNNVGQTFLINFRIFLNWPITQKYDIMQRKYKFLTSRSFICNYLHSVSPYCTSAQCSTHPAYTPRPRNETCDINNHKITQHILEKHTIKLDFIHHNNLMHINTYRLGSVTCVNMDAPQEVWKI
jgi:hypothetical protein